MVAGITLSFKFPGSIYELKRNRIKAICAFLFFCFIQLLIQLGTNVSNTNVPIMSYINVSNIYIAHLVFFTINLSSG